MPLTATLASLAGRGRGPCEREGEGHSRRFGKDWGVSGTGRRRGRRNLRSEAAIVAGFGWLVGFRSLPPTALPFGGQERARVISMHSCLGYAGTPPDRAFGRLRSRS